MIEDIKHKLDIIYKKYVNNDILKKIENRIKEKFKKYEYISAIKRPVLLYYKKNIFIKIDERTTDQKTYKLNENELYVGKFVKEIIIVYLLRKVLPKNIIKIKKYYFNSNKQILIMNRIELTLYDYLKSDNRNEKTVNNIFRQIFLIIGILQDTYKFMHNDLSLKNILLNKTDKPIKYKFKNNKYIIDCEYIPILIDFATSSIHMINNKSFNVYDTETINNKYKSKNINKLDMNKYRWYILDNNIYDNTFDLNYMFNQIEEKINIIEDYKNNMNIM